MPVPPGNYSEQGSSEPLPCPSGTYQPEPGQFVCLQADPGFFVEAPGSTEQIPCPGGYYQPDSGMGSCIVVPKGSFSHMGSPNPSECPYEGYTDWEGANSANSCRVDFDSDGLLNSVDSYPTSGYMNNRLMHLVVTLMLNAALVVILLRDSSEVDG
tara:strand:+ start:97 stop:564 length:468 start_codon:yes stop_codon:yes gene_type:complete